MSGSHGAGTVPAPDAGAEDGVPLFWLAAVVLRERRLVTWITGLGVLAAVAVMLIRQPTYTTTFTFLPQAPDDQSAAGLASLAGQFGISLGAAGKNEQSPQFYADLLSTRRLLGPLVAERFAPDADSAVRVPLSTFLKVPEGPASITEDKTLRALRRDVVSTSVALRTTGVVTVNIRTRSPYVSLAIAERLLVGLSEFNLRTRQSQAREERVFTESRLADARVSLRAAEDALQRFLLNNRQTDFPALLFQRDRLQREVDLHQEVVTSLAQKYEENRIREVRDTPVITLIEVPALAARPDPRLRALILLLGTTGAFLLGVLLVIVRETWWRDGRQGGDQSLAELRSEWRRMRGAVPT